MGARIIRGVATTMGFPTTATTTAAMVTLHLPTNTTAAQPFSTAAVLDSPLLRPRWKAALRLISRVKLRRALPPNLLSLRPC